MFIKRYWYIAFLWYLFFLLIGYLGVSHYVPWSSSLPSFPKSILPYLCDLTPQRRKKDQVQFLLLIYSLKHDEAPGGQTLKEHQVFYHSHPHQKPSVPEGYTSASLSQSLRLSLMAFCLVCYFFGGRVLTLILTNDKINKLCTSLFGFLMKMLKK